MNILTIDVEEIFHIEYSKHVKRTDLSYRTSQNIFEILDLLDRYNIISTFFVVGKVAEKCIDVMKEIYKRGHEIAFHSYDHRPLWEKTPGQLRKEILMFNQFLNSINVEKCIGFRAPSFSLNNETKWALGILEKMGMWYDSSIFPVKTPLYGLFNAPLGPYKPSHKNILKEDTETHLWEFPLLVYSEIGLRIPAGGGFYLRLLPLSMIKTAIQKNMNRGYPSVLYIHNWELDKKTPKLNLGYIKSFITYHNIKKSIIKLEYLLSKYPFTNFKNYLENAMETEKVN